MDARKNAERFQGFAKLYEDARPQSPKLAADILVKYLAREPQTVVDMGCGTGLSTRLWASRAKEVFGVEPGEDMRVIAAENLKEHANVRLINAFSDATGLPGGVADIVICSQSFHWMEPVSTLREIDRLLKPGGVFAAYDCDWPPVIAAPVERAYAVLFEKVNRIEREHAHYRDAVIRYRKDEHLENIKRSGYFTYAREILFMNTEPCDAARYVNIAASQGGLQAILRRDPELVGEEYQAFLRAVHETFGAEIKEIGFCYRMRLGVK